MVHSNIFINKRISVVHLQNCINTQRTLTHKSWFMCISNWSLKKLLQLNSLISQYDPASIVRDVIWMCYLDDSSFSLKRKSRKHVESTRKLQTREFNGLNVTTFFRLAWAMNTACMKNRQCIRTCFVNGGLVIFLNFNSIQKNIGMKYGSLQIYFERKRKYFSVRKTFLKLLLFVVKSDNIAVKMWENGSPKSDKRP